jgi:predicted glycoside hydrolase/deacetylase ChbG (UPF0249 family)
MKRFVLCADDFGYNPQISATIIELIEKKIISATSCMTNRPNWPQAAKQLALLKTQAQIGLHLNLTEGKPRVTSYTMRPLGPLIRAAFTKRLNFTELCEEIESQLLAFKQHMGRLPDFIDGHQHVHHLPTIRNALLFVYLKHYPQKKAWIRVSCNGFAQTLKQSLRCPKALIIGLTGAYSLKKHLLKESIPFNPSFSGIYSLKPHANYAHLFQRFLHEIADGGLIFCHPGAHSPSATDAIAQARQQEYDFFNAKEYTTLLKKMQCSNTAEAYPLLS